MLVKTPKHLDRIDRNILVQLQKNGRISNVELAKEVGLSPSPCLERVKRLEAQGYIKGYHAVVDPEKLGAGPNYQCPINHLLDFVHNAQRFHSKWGFYPCVNVLNAYADQGFINADFKQNGIKIKHLPQQVEEDKADAPVEQLTVTNAQNNVEFTSFHSPEKGSDLLSTTA